MNAGGDGDADAPATPTPQPGESGPSRRSEAEADSASADYGATGSASGATEGLPPGAEMLRRASGRSIDSFSGEGGDLNLVVAAQFQPRYPHFAVHMRSDRNPT